MIQKLDFPTPQAVEQAGQSSLNITLKSRGLAKDEIPWALRRLWLISEFEQLKFKLAFSQFKLHVSSISLELIQSEVSQKDKDHYSILTHIYGIQKDGNDNPVCKT